MRIVLDLQTCQAAARYDDFGQGVLSLARALVQRGPEHDIRVILNSRLSGTIEALRVELGKFLPQDRIHVFDVPGPVAACEPANAWRSRAAERIRAHFVAGLHPDVVLFADVFQGLGDEVVTPPSNIDARHDTVILQFETTSLAHNDNASESVEREWYYRRLQTLRNADRVLLTSNHDLRQATELLQLTPGRAVELTLAADRMFRPLDLPADDIAGMKSKLGLSLPFIMVADSANNLRDLGKLIDAYALLPDEVKGRHHLVVTGNLVDAQRRSLRELIRLYGIDDAALIMPGRLSSEDSLRLYNMAELFVCPAPSAHPDMRILEAFACGTAVIAGYTALGAELIERTDALFDRENPREIAAMMERVLSNPYFSKSLKAHSLTQCRKFNWEASAEIALEVFQDLRRRRGNGSPTVSLSSQTKRRRLAYLSPLSPERTGIADYSAELLPALARYYDIELVTVQPGVSNPAISANFPIRSVNWFDRHAGEFDRIVYHFGNSQYHLHMFDLLRRHPGVVVLHDFFLSGAQFNLEHYGVVPNAVALALYESHGYRGLIEERQNGRSAALWKYPCNKSVLDHAAGIIVHSRFSHQLAEKWYGAGAAREWRTIPHLRATPQPLTRSDARARIKLDEDAFLVCSFGMLGPSKCNARLIEAWLTTPMARDLRCHLVFVGANDEGDYGRDLLNTIAASGCRDRIKITGFADEDMYRAYLSASDVCAQLRSHSRGETSGAILDCLAHGIATIANANGAAGEIPDSVLWKLPDHFSQEDLTRALIAIHETPDIAQQFKQRALAYCRTVHHPAVVAEMYFEAIEYFAVGAEQKAYRTLLDDLTSDTAKAEPHRSDLISAARCIASNMPRKRPQQLLVDVSAIALHDYKTGIQRVVRSILNVLLNSPPEGYRVEPIFSTGEHYMYARKFTLSLVDVPDFGVEDAPIEIFPGDIFIGLDLFTHGIALNHHRFVDMRDRGANVYFVVYDILPILRPDAFPERTDFYYSNWVRTVSTVADGAICISRAVADELTDWLEKNSPNRYSDLAIGYFHLGADIVASVPTSGLASDTDNIDRRMRDASTILVVGTLEPRKGHAQVLSAFEILWAENIEVNLVIVGKNGWMVDELVKRLRDHPEIGNRLFWLENASDEMLMKLYDTSSALLVASEGEGFGLPLIEAAQHKLPIIARDLPVFREVAEQHAFYFSGRTAEALAIALKDWMQLHGSGSAPSSMGMKWLTWEESTQQLLDVAFDKKWYKILAAKRTIADRSATRQLLVDVSAISRHDLQTGIERIVRAQLQELMNNPPAEFRVEPVYLTDLGGKWHYRYAQAYKQKLISGGEAAISDAAVTVAAHDVFYAPDFFPGGVVEAGKAGLYTAWRKTGVEINFLVHDILPILSPEFFPPDADALHMKWLENIGANADRLICVSNAVAIETEAWLRNRRRGSTAVPKFSVVHHGADISASAPSRGMPETAKDILHQIAAVPSFLMVGTIEPRKGHLQALAAFEQLWQEGHPVNLVIVGREGWTSLKSSQRRTIPKIIDKLQGHPELGKRLFWLQGISDEFLEHIYDASACLLAPSEGEGFGLPLIEAARHQLPIVARDLPVFREVAQGNALYFSGLQANDLRTAIVEWMQMRANGGVPSSGKMTWRTWMQNADELLRVLSGKITI